MSQPVWIQGRVDLGQAPIVEGQIGSSAPMYAERYLYQTSDRTVSGLPCTLLITQFGGSRVHEGERDHWRLMNLPTQSILLPAGVPTHWHYSGMVDFAAFYFLAGGGLAMQNLEALARSRDEPMPFNDVLVSAAALRLMDELRAGIEADADLMSRLAVIMLEQTFRALTTPGSSSINARHPHFTRLQPVLEYVHVHLTEDMSVDTLAEMANVSAAHFRRIFQEAVGVPPHRYILGVRLDQARRLLTTSDMPIARVAQECGFSSQSHLTASFRAAHAVTPAQFRTHAQGGR
jgi:AraC family transcriptional regulator